MFGFFAPILLIAVLGVVVGAYYTGRSDGFAAHEVAAQQQALTVTKQSLATSERLRAEGDEASARVRADANAEIAAIRFRAADAQALRNAHADRADKAQESADGAWELVDALNAETCPAPPEECPWDCRLPELDE